MTEEIDTLVKENANAKVFLTQNIQKITEEEDSQFKGLKNTFNRIIE